jgi:hypothetical protein
MKSAFRPEEATMGDDSCRKPKPPSGALVELDGRTVV